VGVARVVGDHAAVRRQRTDAGRQQFAGDDDRVPYLINGAYPDSFVSARVPMSQAGIWQRGMVDLGSNVAYISHDGS